MAPEQITLSTEAPAVPMPPFAFVYQFRWLNERSERAVYGFETIADALYDKPGIQPDDPGHRITVEVEPVIVRFEDLHERDRAAYLAAVAEGNPHPSYALEDGETVPTPAAVEIPPEAREEVRRRIHRMYPGLAAARSGHQPGSYAEYVARREARLARKADRYGEWAESRERKETAEHNRVHFLLDGIPAGQPILVGHHSERGHRRTLEKADNAMRRAVENHQMAESHAHKSAACARALDKQYKPGFCYRRIEDGKKELRQAERRKWQEGIEHAKEKIAFWEARLEAAGGLRITLDQIHKGDVVDTTFGPYEVIRVNKKTISITGWLYPGGTYTLPVDDIKSVLKRAEA